MQEQYELLFSPKATQFLVDLVQTFQTEIDTMLRNRIARQLELDQSGSLPDFDPATAHIRTGDWKVDPLPTRLLDVRVCLGDVSPSNREHLCAAMASSAQAVQIDFDDGHCPAWGPHLTGLANVVHLVQGRLSHQGQRLSPQAGPVMKLRPRAWNMVEHNVMVGGRPVNGALLDFALLLAHVGPLLHAAGAGPWLYLSKLEGAAEARLWDRIFVFAETRLGLPSGAIRATVLIENILASFEMHEIVHALRTHAAGLNCGMWDYSASVVAKLGARPAFLLPDRSKYVDMERHFLRCYLALVVQTCHRRGCIATGGMAAKLLAGLPTGDHAAVIAGVRKAKAREIEWGVDGFLVYDPALIAPMLALWEERVPGQRNQLHVTRGSETFGAADLLLMPPGGVTRAGLALNITVGILFIFHWLNGRGHFTHRGAVEDSATAEISRSQVWQWIRHRATLEDDGALVTRTLVAKAAAEITRTLRAEHRCPHQAHRIDRAAAIFMQLVSSDVFPNFITTLLSTDSTFLAETTAAAPCPRPQ